MDLAADTRRQARCGIAAESASDARSRYRWIQVCTCEQAGKHRRDTLAERTLIMSASHHPTDIHLRQHRTKKRNKLRARIAAAPASGRAALEAKLQRTYSRSHSSVKNKPPTVA